MINLCPSFSLSLSTDNVLFLTLSLSLFSRELEREITMFCSENDCDAQSDKFLI